MQLLKDLVKSSSISVAEFMEIALYHPKYGYYMNKNPIGKTGDFITAPEVSQLFGEIVGIWVILQWEKLGKPKKITLMELGPGRGAMTLDILRMTEKYFSVDLYLVEVSPTLKNIQAKILDDYKDNIIWQKDISDLSDQPTIFIANEFFDALPIRQFIRKESWYERVISMKNDELIFTLRETNESFEGASKNAIIEINKVGQNIFNKIKDHIPRNGGAALIIDYGYLERPYVSTLQAIKEHKYHDTLSNIGEADITAHVDFSIFEDCQIMSQREFLHSYGIKERAAMLLKKANIRQAQDIMTGLKRLTHPELMGNIFKCAIL